MSREAIGNTIIEMRSVVDRQTDARSAYYVNRSDIKDWADAIEKSVADILAENARLKAALKPVLEVEWPTGISGGIDNQLLEPLTRICNAVRSAQLIYNGGAE